MSRFLKFINESMRPLNFSDEQIAEMIKKNCSQYLNETNNGEYMLTRGMHIDDNYSYLLIPLKNRQERDTHPLAHKALDDAFEKKFGIRLRSESTFCTLNNFASTISYGHLFIIFPYNNYKLFYSPFIEDLSFYVPYNKDDENTVNRFNHSNKIIEIISKYKKAQLSDIGNKFKKSKPFHEIMLICSKYIALSAHSDKTVNILNMLNLKVNYNV